MTGDARPAVTVVGLGPGPFGQLTLDALAAIEATGHCVVRTRRHPAVDDLAARGLVHADCDDVYDRAADLDAAYDAIATSVCDAAQRHGRVVYAVPGSPWVAESTVQRVVALADRRGIDVDVVDGLSFLEPVLGAVRGDALTHGLVVADGRRFELPTDTAVPLVVAQVDHAFVLGEVKLALLDAYPPDHEVVLVVDAGGAEPRLRRVALAELDHAGATTDADTDADTDTDPGPRASLFVPPFDAGLPFTVGAAHRAAGRAFARLVALQDRLRGPGGCPWDAEQTHRSLRPYLLEETYEVADAIDALPPDAPAARDADATEFDAVAYADLAEELGDFLYQAVFHACLATEAGAFDARDVLDGVVDKLVSRHPHVFGDEVAATSADVLAGWDRRKAAEKGRDSVLDGLPVAAPALVRAGKVLARTGRVGVDWDAGAADALHAAVSALRASDDDGTTAADATGDAGEALLALTALVRAVGADPEAALRAALARHEAELRGVEAAGGTDALDGVVVWDTAPGGEDAAG